MQQISLYCECCMKTWTLDKTPELPARVFNMRCSWCPSCEDRAEDYYQEWWDEKDNPEDGPVAPVPDNQLCMPFIFDEIGIPQPEIVNS